MIKKLWQGVRPYIGKCLFSNEIKTYKLPPAKPDPKYPVLSKEIYN